MKLLTYSKPFFIPGTFLILSILLAGCGGGSSKKQESPPVTVTSSSVVATSSSVVATSSSSLSSSSVTATSSSITTSNSSSSTLTTSSSSSSTSSTSSNASSSKSSSSLVAQTGVFIDSAVQGLHYETTPGGFSGSTSIKGEYQYAEGDMVTFSIGNLLFPSITAKGVVTPLDLAKTSSATNQIALNIAALLQSLDTDGDADNGISINYATAAAQATVIDFDVPYASFAASPAVTSLVANSGSSTKTLVSEASASAHLQTSMNKINSADLIGTWYVENNGSKYVLLVLNSNEYVSLIYEGGATIERGTYSWDKTTSHLLATPKIIAGTARTIAPPFFDGNILSANKSSLTVTGWGGTTVFSKLDNSSNPLIGGWVLGSSVVVFTENYYFQGQTNPADHAGKPGAEYGTYNRSGADITYKTLADTNLQWGFSHPCNIVETHMSETPNDLSCLNGKNLKDSVSVSNNTLDVFSAANVVANQTNEINTDEPEHYYFQRVIQNDFDVLGTPNPLLGTWSWSLGGNSDTFTFSDALNFTHTKIATTDDDCQPGSATAAYTWNPITFRLNLNVSSDTTGGCVVGGNFNLLTPKGNTLVLSDGTGGTEGVNQFTFIKQTK